MSLSAAQGISAVLLPAWAALNGGGRMCLCTEPPTELPFLVGLELSLNFASRCQRVPSGVVSACCFPLETALGAGSLNWFCARFFASFH